MPLKAPCYIPLAGLKDFGRLACALERAPMPSFSLTLGGKQVLAVQLDILNGRPVIYYAEAEIGPNTQYLAYRASGGMEEVTLAEAVGNPTFVYSPILKVDRFPPALAKNARIDKKKSGYTVIKLRDLASLAKVAAYKTIYEEAPLPLFYSREEGNRHILGTPMSVNENDSVSYYYYVALDGEPAAAIGPFLRYSSQKPEQPTFTASLDEHGFIYMKVVRLADGHPLVKSYEG
ncbi:hypothetical protein [Nitrososphaera sp.]|uniref:hypothetical protein n=1 Tax=Nitrososphaera sp. TaxID=1971748 RepID=UPI00307F8597